MKEKIENENRDLLHLLSVFINPVVTAKYSHRDVSDFTEKSWDTDDFEFRSDEDEMANGSTFIIWTEEEINALTFLQDKGTDPSMLKDYPIITDVFLMNNTPHLPSSATVERLFYFASV